MKKLIFSLLAISMITASLQAQKYFTRQGNVSFSSESKMEKIEAHNSSATSVMDAESGRMEFAVLVKAFHFEKALMEEHFNENYLESGKYPKAVFKGNITNMKEVDLKMDGTYNVNVKGEMTMHGVTQPMEETGTITVKNGAIFCDAKFDLLLADYDIKIPSVVKDNIAETVQVEVDISYQVFNK